MPTSESNGLSSTSTPGTNVPSWQYVRMELSSAAKKPWPQRAGTHSCRWFSADSQVPNQRPYVGDLRRRSTMTSKMRPAVHCTSLAYGAQCIPRMVPAREHDMLICRIDDGRDAPPTLSTTRGYVSSLKISWKNPRSSGYTGGATRYALWISSIGVTDNRDLAGRSTPPAEPQGTSCCGGGCCGCSMAQW
jgi:hypothetical protein